MQRKLYLAVLLLSLISGGMPIGAQDRQLEREKTKVTEKRIALVIGNGAYLKAKTLPNPANDAADMAKALKEVGFEVLSGVDLNKRQMQDLIRDFGTKLASGSVGLFYYAGHGVQVGGANYLIPVDANIPKEDEVEFEAVSLGLILTKMSSAKNDLNIVILDACRNNPFARSWSSYRDSGSSEGLAKISPPTGTLVLYATEPGKVASDGTGRNGLFTEALLKQMIRPNVEYDAMVKALSADVWQRSNRQQLPWKEGNSLQDFYFSKTSESPTQPNSTAVAPRPTPLPTPTPVTVAQNFDAEAIYWQEINRRDTRSGYELYLAEYPNGKHVTDATNRINKFKQDELARLKGIEQAKWSDAQNLDTREGYNAYLAAYSSGEFAADARLSIKTLESKEEQAKWDEVQVLNRKTAFQSYLSIYPNGRYAQNAKQKVKEFEEAEVAKQKELEKAAEKAKWDTAESKKTLAGYKDYLAAYPRGEFASLSRLRLRDLGEVVGAQAVNSSTPVGNDSGAIRAGTVRKNSLGLELVYIPPGEFMMGSTSGGKEENPAHSVTIARGFWIGKYEVTQGQWEQVMGTTMRQHLDKHYKGYTSRGEGVDIPMYYLTWNDAKDFIRHMNQASDGFEYSLPSEAEWEYAARAGTTSDYYGPLDEIAWYGNNSGRVPLDADDLWKSDSSNYSKRLNENSNQPHTVGTKSPNSFGLYDMLGNVMEWCEDIYNKDGYRGLPTDGSPNIKVGDPNLRVARGGSFGGAASTLRFAFRGAGLPLTRSSNLGFRVAARLRKHDLDAGVDAPAKPSGTSGGGAASAGKMISNSLAMKFAYIPAGSFQMGGMQTDSEKPIHTVTISQGFYLGTTEVTQAQWVAVMWNNPSSFNNCDNCPVENVSWEDVQAFIKKLNDRGDGKYRLPTEAEWEYAARAGSITKYSFGDSDGSLGIYAWYDENSGSRTHEVATKQPNAWGLYDMYGNVWEWVQDWYGNYPNGNAIDPAGIVSGSDRVLRGGSWGTGVATQRSASRSAYSPSIRDQFLGFRVVKY